jgi:hypothetical protein
MKARLKLTESLTRMNWSTSMTGGALKASAVGGAAMGRAAGTAAGTTGSATALFLGGRGMSLGFEAIAMMVGGFGAADAYRLVG